MKSINQAYINGQWVNSSSNKTFDVINPSTLEVIAKVTDCNEQDTTLAIDAASKAFKTWSKTPAKVRAQYLKKAEQLMLDHVDEIAKLLSLENGKPFMEAKAEVIFSSGYLGWFAEQARNISSEVIPSPYPNKRLHTEYTPLGVVGAFTPWNFPANMITRKIAPALAAGCTVVLKPAPDTPLTALYLAKIFDLAGFPKGTFNILPALDPKPISETMLVDRRIKMIGFTGSTAVGKMLMAESAKQLKRLSLELGGNAPAIVLPEVDIDKAIDRIIAIKYLRVGGESCICANRIFVHSHIYDEFVEKFTAKVKLLTVGDAFTEGAQVGPLINQTALKRITKLVNDTVELGAKVLTGGKPYTDNKLNGYFYEPTVLVDCQDDWPIAQNETFGPIAPIFKYDTIEEVIERANNTNYGLASYIFGKNINQVNQVTEALEFGFIGINDGDGYTHEIPIGGFKESGIGREGGKEGIIEYMEIKAVLMNLD
ncbi:NAD-dependent succinate-semialdehyde dehydrogenase [Thiotrichales bacterium 19S3-7]|nr:NAD-dependent succinate-semialdehyde dehydrogenase [Thiotrichales bacterium 19S3-7]MCF6802487.1 NAD-dependent succinate-semialdehyde dehydrogenase [Thiotrichales bacterium 19S3-11]